MSALNVAFWRRALSASLIIAHGPELAFAELAPDAGSVVTDAVNRTLLALKDDRISDTEANSILELIDIEGVARFSLGRHWRDQSLSEQADFVEAFRLFARAQLRDHLAQLAGAEIETVRSIEQRAQFATILDRNGGDIRSLIRQLRPIS